LKNDGKYKFALRCAALPFSQRKLVFWGVKTSLRCELITPALRCAAIFAAQTCLGMSQDKFALQLITKTLHFSQRKLVHEQYEDKFALHKKSTR